MSSPIEERLTSRISRDADGCWRWLGSLATHGYGTIYVDGRYRSTHRVAYELWVGPIPNGLYIDHLCRVRSCINPAHLEPVTCGENTLRGIGPSARNLRKTHCQRGHPLSGDNLIVRVGVGRACRKCRVAHQRHTRALATRVRCRSCSWFGRQVTPSRCPRCNAGTVLPGCSLPRDHERHGR